MTEAVDEFDVAAASAYDDLFVPAMFQQWADPVLNAARVGAGNRVLDVACGTGVLARAAKAQVGPSGSVTGLDLNAGMLEVARRNDPGIEWQQGTADALPFAAGSYDAVVSQFGLMFFPDRKKSIQEMLRVLRPGGRVAIAVWNSLQDNPLFMDEVALLERIGGRAACDALRAPFSLGDGAELVALARQGGVSAVELQTLAGTAVFPSFRTLVEADVRGWLPIMGVELEESVIQEILAAAEPALAHHTRTKGRAEFPVSAHVLSGEKAATDSRR